MRNVQNEYRTQRVIARALSTFASLALSYLALAQSLPNPDQLTEGSASIWGVGQDQGASSVFNDSVRVKVGAQSLRFETTSGFDCWLLAPKSQNANWNFAAALSGGLSFWAYAENPNIGFQNLSPWIRLHTTSVDYLELHATGDWLNDARNRWHQMRIPLAGNKEWSAARFGNPDLSHINWIEIHADTWEYGFKLWVDGLRFDEPISAPVGQRASILNHAVKLKWSPYTDPYGLFDSFRVYRSTAPFTNVTGMTPIASVTGIGTTTFTDSTALNNVSYYYAVTAKFSNGQETTQVPSMGPRTPRAESDLQIATISRSPLYPRYDVAYTNYTVTDPSGFGPYEFSAATGLNGGQNASTKRWPNIGEPVTYTATIRNRGTNFFGGVVAIMWSVDGVPLYTARRGVLMNPGDTVSLTFPTTWDGLNHDIRAQMFVSNAGDSRPGNNTLSIQSNSVAYLSFFDQSYAEDFREDTKNFPNATTDDFVDWVNKQMARFNALFAAAGSPKRVHYDVLQMLDDTMEDPNVQRINYAIFPFRFNAGEQSYRRVSGYYQPLDDIDYAYLHEMGHQLGLIDMYRMNVEESQNQVNGQLYRTVDCLMNGVSPFISSHSAGAMTLWQGKAHGYFGQYLYSLPQQTQVRILDHNRTPVSGATVTVYQKCTRPGVGEVITNQVKASGTTNGQGVYALPNVPVDPALVPRTFAGDELKANPFGYVAVTGENGTFLIKIVSQGRTAFAWLSINELNDAYWSGQTGTATIEKVIPSF